MFKRKGGGVKGLLNNVKTALFSHDGFPYYEDYSLKVEVPRGFDPFRERPSVAVQANTGLRKNLVMMVSMVVMMVVSMMVAMVVFMMVKNMIWK